MRSFSTDFFRKLNDGFKDKKISNKKKENWKKEIEKKKKQAERKLLNPEFSSSTASSMKASNSLSGSLASNSRRWKIIIQLLNSLNYVLVAVDSSTSVFC